MAKKTKKTEQNKMQLPEYNLGGIVNPAMIFDLSSDFLVGQSMNAVTQMVKALRDGEQERRMTTKNTGSVMANGGIVPTRQVEVEGDEAFETPQGEVGEFEGPSHEQGGIPVELPVGTKIFSDNITIDRETMANRKKKRESRISKLERLLEKSPKDKLLQQTFERTFELNQLEEMGDMKYQKKIDDFEKTINALGLEPKMKNGGTIDFNTNNYTEYLKYAQGGIIEEGLPENIPTQVNFKELPLPNTNLSAKEAMQPYLTNLRITNQRKKTSLQNLLGKYDSPLVERNPELQDNIVNKFIKQKEIGPIQGEISENDSLIHNTEKLNEIKQMGPKPDPTVSILQLSQMNHPFYEIIKNNPEKFEGSDIAQNIISKVNKEEGLDISEDPVIQVTSNQDTIEPVQDEFINELININETRALQAKLAEATQFKNGGMVNKNEGTVPQEDIDFIMGLMAKLNKARSSKKIEGLNIEFANGTDEDGVPPYTGAPNINDLIATIPGQQEFLEGQYMSVEGSDIPLNQVSTQENPIPYTEDQDVVSGIQDQLMGAESEGLAIDKPSGLFAQILNQVQQGSQAGFPSLTRGDVKGLAGNIQGKYLPLMGTLLNQMETTPNVNAFKEFGADALKSNQQAQGLATTNRDKLLQQLALKENTMRARSRNTARGVNTMRALDIAGDMTGQQGANEAYANYANQMMQLLGQQGQLENLQDRTVMQGEQARDLADRQDTDNFYTQLSKNLANVAEFTQKTGRDLNQAQYNDDLISAMNQMSSYGLTWERGEDGNYKIVYNQPQEEETTKTKKTK